MPDFKKNIDIKKILILRLGAIGDVIHSTALYRSIKKYDPSVSIHYLTTKFPAELIEVDPDLDKVFIIKSKSYKHLFKMAQKLRKEDYDLCINLQPSIRTKFFSFLLGARQNLIYKKTFKLHAVKNFWVTAKSLYKDIELENELKIFLPQDVQNRIESLLDSERNIIAFNVGVSSVRQGRRWPLHYWRKLAELLINKYNCKIVLTGSKDDADIANNLLDVSPKLESFCGKLTLTESAALMSKCRLMISGDTGPLHIAAAVGIPVLGLYGAAPVSRTGPYGPKSYAINSDRECIPCNKRKCKLSGKNEAYNPCMVDLTPELIFDYIKDNNLI